MQVKVNTAELLLELRSNREGHRAEFDEAIVGYRAAVVKHLDRMLEQAKAGKDVNWHVNLPCPKDQTKDYDRVIKMFEMEVAETVDLEEHEFAQYVMDDWSWKDQFTATISNYK